MNDQPANRPAKGGRLTGAAGRPTVGIRELKAKASAIIDDVKGSRISYAVTRRGSVEALIVPADAGEKLTSPSPEDESWEAWQALADRLARDARAPGARSAARELDRMRR